MVLCVGEILVDMIATMENQNVSYQRKAGGAPFNVACAISKFGGKSSFIGSVGNDTIGDFLKHFIKKQNDLSPSLSKSTNANVVFLSVC